MAKGEHFPCCEEEDALISDMELQEPATASGAKSRLNMNKKVRDNGNGRAKHKKSGGSSAMKDRHSHSQAGFAVCMKHFPERLRTHTTRRLNVTIASGI